jgi:hypothetical protein
MRLRGYHKIWLLLVFSLISCDRTQPLAPDLDARATSSGPTLNAPSGTNVVAVSWNQVNVSWQDNSTNESGFEVHRSTTGPSGAFAFLVSTQVDVSSYGNGGLSGTSQYCYKIRAFRTIGGKTGYSQFSAIACATTPPPPAPAAPANADAWPAGSTNAGVVWTDNSMDEDGFRVERSLDAGSTWITAGTAGPNTTLLYDNGRASEQQVCYRVIAFSDGGDSPPSNTDCTVPPAAPTNLTWSMIDSTTGEVELTWTDNSAVEDGYQVQVFPCCSQPSYWVSLPTNSTTFRVFVTEEAFVDVAAIKDGGASDFIDVVVTLPPAGSAPTGNARSRSDSKR